MHTIRRWVIFAVSLLALQAWAIRTGEEVTIATRDGQTVTGVLVRETNAGFLIKSGQRTQLIAYEVVVTMTPASAARAPAPVASSPPRSEPVQPKLEEAPTSSAPRVSDAQVTFFAKDRSNHYLLQVGDRSCQTPCTLDLPTGFVPLTGSGSGKLAATLDVPAGLSSVELQHGSVVRGVGLVMSTIGLGLGLISIAVFSAGASLVGGIVMLAIAGGISLPGVIMSFAAPKQTVELRPGKPW